MNDAALKAFQQKLDETHTWPCIYVFKFIVPRAELPQLQAVFAGHRTITRESANGKYTSLTAELPMTCSADVIAIYAAALKIKGALSL